LTARNANTISWKQPLQSSYPYLRAKHIVAVRNIISASKPMSTPKLSARLQGERFDLCESAILCFDGSGREEPDQEKSQPDAFRLRKIK
jgi:hypothetical protein